MKTGLGGSVPEGGSELEVGRSGVMPGLRDDSKDLGGGDEGKLGAEFSG